MAPFQYRSLNSYFTETKRRKHALAAFPNFFLSKTIWGTSWRHFLELGSEVTLIFCTFIIKTCFISCFWSKFIKKRRYFQHTHSNPVLRSFGNMYAIWRRLVAFFKLLKTTEAFWRRFFLETFDRKSDFFGGFYEIIQKITKYQAFWAAARKKGAISLRKLKITFFQVETIRTCFGIVWLLYLILNSCEELNDAIF